LLPALSKAKAKTQGIRCMNNLKQTQLGWHLYALDNESKIVLNWLSAGKSWISGNVSSMPGATNLDDIKNGKLFQYNPSVDIYRCAAASGPKDLPSTLSPAQMRGKTLVRHISMQGRMGGSTTPEGGDTSWVLGAKYPQYARETDIVYPPPSEAMVFLDESKETVDDGYFAVKAPAPDGPDIWQNSPTVRHNKGAGFSFADGHAEIWRWQFLNKDQGLDASVNIGGGVSTLKDLNRVKNAVARIQK